MLYGYYDDIPIGKPITKEELMHKWHMTERQVRNIIADLRAEDFGDDYIIISSASGKGYYRSNSLEDIKKFKQEIENRAKHTFIPLRKVNRVLRDADQLKLVNNLKQARQDAGYTACDVVQIINMRLDQNFDKYMLSKMENGLCSPNNVQLSILSEIYEKSPEDLVGLIVS